MTLINTRGVTAPPPKNNLDLRFERRKVLIGTVDSRTFPHCGKSKFG
jgi:hypothetical protein